MKSSLFLLLLLLLLFVPLPSQVAAAPIVFDHYTLALTWPNSFCELAKFKPKPCQNTGKTDLPQIFTVHGFWPAFANGTSVPYASCAAVPFMYTKLNYTVRSLADMYWPDVKMSEKRKGRPGLSTDFWTHEWDHHGICSNLQQADYMYLALTVYNKVQQYFIDLVNKYQNIGKQTVDVIQFQADLQILLGGRTPTLVCENVKNSSKKQYLSEIRVRVEKSFPYGLLPDRSHSTIKCNTSKTVYFPTFL